MPYNMAEIMLSCKLFSADIGTNIVFAQGFLLFSSANRTPLPLAKQHSLILCGFDKDSHYRVDMKHRSDYFFLIN